ncbi:hypothetical protein Back2_21240 [Nocardioides baekrokdamisoli]|uniref:ResB-like domain-containing protein n=1 Tax=Nocardioides baekrokdamisoli TaxID=1804624 RepID=A0A3G9IFT6_9ACTN|nr:cytochrome c biogenesis protein ResB [Nocardioides baekrokdamisoli]BBH17837.1 hypothetical protein Back2_21240 [Nocardioides baekrokdamisoli]
MTEDLAPAALGPVAFARWIWRQLTSMRTALILLLLLAIASIPGSLIPQDGLDPNKSALWRSSHPHLTPIYRRLDLFNVYSAPWFAAIYVLLMVSLVGCIIPRLFVYARAMRAQPPRTPKHLGRFADSIAYVTDDAPAVVLDETVAHLRGYRLRRDDATSISAERGYLREAGNLIFHLSIIIVLVGFATGQLFGYKGAVQVVVGSTVPAAATPIAPVVAPAKRIVHDRTYVVRRGDSLSVIAQRELGDARGWPKIFALSRGLAQPGGGRLSDANLIQTGWRLRLPGTATPVSKPSPATSSPSTPAQAQANYGFSNELTQYDDFSRGSLWKASMLDPFTLHINNFTMDWSRGALGGDFDSTGTYDIPGQTSQPFDLKVNHPLSIGSTNVFLIGHGYAPIITLRDTKGQVVASGPTIFLPVDAANFQSVGAILARFAKPNPIGLECTFLPFASADEISSISGDLTAGGHYPRGAGALLSCFAYKGNLGESTAFTIDSSGATKVTGPGGRAFNMMLKLPGRSSVKLANGTVLTNTVTLPGGLGSLSFDGIAEWNRLQISQQPGRLVALGGVILALFGLMGSLFIRPRRVWVRATTTAGGTLVEIAALDRTGGGDIAAYVNALKDKLTTKELTRV